MTSHDQLLISTTGVITRFTFIPANRAKWEALLEASAKTVELS